MKNIFFLLLLFSLQGFGQHTQIVQGAAAASSTALKTATTTTLQSVTRSGKLTAIVTDTAAGGTFNYSSASLTANGGTIFAATGGGYWVRDISQSNGVNALWFGVVGDSITPNSAAIQNIINNTNASIIYFPVGNYVLDSSIIMRSNLTILGQGEGTHFIVSSSFRHNPLRAVFIAEGISNITLEKFSLNVNNSERFAFSTDSACVDIRLEKIHIANTEYHGMFIQGTNFYINECIIEYSGNNVNPSFVHSASMYAAYVHNLNLTNNIFRNNREHGIYIYGGTGYILVSNNESYGNGGYGLSVRSNGMRITGNYVHGNGFGGNFGGVHMSAAILPDVKAEQAILSNNVIIDNVSTSSDLIVSGVNDLVVSGNTIRSGSTGYTVKMSEVSNAILSDNTITSSSSGAMGIFGDVSHVSINSNIFHGFGGGSAIRFYNGANATDISIKGNKIDSFALGVYFDNTTTCEGIKVGVNDYRTVTTKTNFTGTLTNVEDKDRNPNGYANTRDITQASHGLILGNVVRFDGVNYVKALADSISNSDVVGIVSYVIDVNTFVVTLQGYITGLSGLVAGSKYYLSSGAAGLLTRTEPSANGQISKPLLIAASTSAGYFYPSRDKIVTETVTTVNNTSYTAIPTDDIINISNIGAATNITVTLPNANSVPIGHKITVMVSYAFVDQLTRTIYIKAQAGNVVNGVDSIQIEYPYAVREFISSGTTSWYMEAGKPTSRKALSNTDYTITKYDRYVAYSVISANRAITLPPASSVLGGTAIVIGDETGNANAVNRIITITADGSDLIDGASSTTITSPYKFITLFSNGTSKWSFNKSLAPSDTSLFLSGYQTAINAKKANSDSATNNSSYTTLYQLKKSKDSILSIISSSGIAIDSPQHTYVGSPVISAGTAPSGATTHTYQWTRVGKLVTLRINLLYAVAGATVTVCTIPLPSDCPTPLIPTGYTTNDNYGAAIGYASVSTPGLPVLPTRCYLAAVATPSIVMTIASGAYIHFFVTVQYFTN